MRRSHALALSFLLPLLTLSWYLGTDLRAQPAPRVIIDASVDQSFAAVIEETWLQFLSVFAARRDCFGDVRVKADYDLSDRAIYDPQTATVSVHVPARKAILKGALVHEWAHHVEFRCKAQTEMRAAFIKAQGMSANTPWRLEDGTTNISSSDWAIIPSEQYAETVVVVVLGERPFSTGTPITAEGMEVISVWIQKKNLSGSTGSWTDAAADFVHHFASAHIHHKEAPMK